jgi:hypothetical protein
MARRTVTVEADDYGDATIRLSLREPSYTNDVEIATGVFARSLWVGRKYVVLLTYSQWQQRDGTCRGDQYQLCTVADAGMIRHVFGDDATEQMLNTLRVPVRNIDGEAVPS